MMNSEIMPESGNLGCRYMIELVATPYPRILIDDEMPGKLHETGVEVPALEGYCAEEKKS